jgi:hypothetical protein
VQLWLRLAIDFLFSDSLLIFSSYWLLIIVRPSTHNDAKNLGKMEGRAYSEEEMEGAARHTGILVLQDRSLQICNRIIGSRDHAEALAVELANLYPFLVQRRELLLASHGQVPCRERSKIVFSKFFFDLCEANPLDLY